MRPTISNLSLLSLVLSTATAVPQHELPVTTSAKAQSIPITKRSTFNPALLDPVDRWNMLKEGVARTQSKYNIFNAIPGLNATEVKPARRMMGRQRFKKSDIQMGTVPRDIFYFATVTLGTPPVAFEVSLDTGSSDLIIAAPQCTSGCTSSTILYRTVDSSSAYSQGTPFRIQYQGGGASGTLVSDVMSFGGYRLNDQTFGAITQSSTVVSGAGSVSGLLGLGWRPIAASGALPFVQALWQSGQLPLPMFSFAFASYGTESTSVAPGGIMTLGGVNSQFFSGAINYIPAPTRAFWTIQLDNIILGSSKSLGINFANVNIDTGTTNIYMPLHAATTLFNAIPGSQSVGYGLYTIPCNSISPIQLVFGGVAYTVPPANVNIGYADNQGINCYSAFTAIGQNANGDDQYIFGDAFLKNVYSVFRFSPPAVGFATLANPGNSLFGGSVPKSNGTTIAEGGNNVQPLVSSGPGTPAPAPVALVSSSSVLTSASPTTSPSVPSPPSAPLVTPTVLAAVPPAGAGSSSSSSIDYTALANKLQNAVTSVIAANLKNALLFLTCKPPRVIDESTLFWTCN